MSASAPFVDRLLDANIVPDGVIRAVIRRNLAARLRDERRRRQADPDVDRTFLADRSAGPVAVDTAAANRQHYDVPTEFYQLVLGPHLKYSSAWWEAGDDLARAEARMLACYGERAALTDGQRVLELGCGWGSLSLWMAARFPRSRVLGVSNSRSQKAWIDAAARARGLTNLEIVTADMNAFAPPGRFDRVVSVEMFEHMRNWRELLCRIHGWLEDDGQLFVHIFTHRAYGYPYEPRDPSDWMARYFFTGGIMPSDDLLTAFPDVFRVADRWRVPGTHYQRTAEAWLANMTRQRAAIWPILERTYGQADARRWWVRWRVFFMACAELWGYAGGTEWMVSHYRLERAVGA